MTTSVPLVRATTTVPHLDRLVRLDDERERSLLAGLDRRRGHDDRVGVGRQRDDDVDELPGPQTRDLSFGKGALDPDRAGRRIDRCCRRT